MISALLLCAGEGRRMGTAKTLLKIGEDTMVKHCARRLLGSRVDEVVAVTGHMALEVERELRDLNSSRLRVVHNPNYRTGLMSSIRAGARGLSSSTKSFLITLADLPELESRDFDRLIEFAVERRAKLARYVHKNRPAHPVWIDAGYLQEIRNCAPSAHGLAFLFVRDPAAWLATDSPAGVRDIDTPKDILNAHLTS
jgi:CTP:molybdopterin cytidylyltransferase MocA